MTISDLDYLQAGGNFQKGVNKFGRNIDIRSTGAEDIIDTGGTWTAPTEARTHNIASSSAADIAADTGAHTVRVYGLTSWDTAEESEVVILDGTSDVLTANSYVIIHRMQCLSWGTGGVNAGNITATATTDATITAQISIGNNQTLMACYGVPSIYECSVISYYHSVNKSQAASVNCDLLINEYPEDNLSAFAVKHVVATSSKQQHEFRPPLTVQGPAIIKLRGDSSSASATDVSGGFDLVLRNK